jgi:hypothetical protein
MAGESSAAPGHEPSSQLRRGVLRCSIVDMSAELARRLLETGVVPADEIYAALSDAVALGVPFVQALVTRGPLTADLVDRELSRLRGPVLSSITVSHDLTENLPTGLCERLLAVPIGLAPSGAVEVAAVDPTDLAVGDELAFQLGAPVSIVRVPLGELLLALDRWLDERDRTGVRSTRTPAFGTRAVRRGSSPPFRQAYRVSTDGGADQGTNAHQSWPPIPLVRRSMPAPERSRIDTNPGVGSAGGDLLGAIGFGVDETGTGVLGLNRSKAPPPIERRREPDLTAFDGAADADALVAHILDAARPLAERVLILTARGAGYAARAAHPDDVSVLLGAETVASFALRDGHYLGPIPADEAHQDLAGALGQAEVYVVPVRIGDRAPICLVLSGLFGSLDSTRWADAIARRAEDALERILRDRKRGG